MMIEPEPIPPHMLEAPRSNAQKKAFAKVKRAVKAESAPTTRSPAKKASSKRGAKKSASASKE